MLEAAVHEPHINAMFNYSQATPEAQPLPEKGSFRKSGEFAGKDRFSNKYI